MYQFNEFYFLQNTDSNFSNPDENCAPPQFLIAYFNCFTNNIFANLAFELNFKDLGYGKI
jgi:hypothetical protein